MKKCIVAMMMALCCVPAMAQNENGEFESKWFVNAGVGVLSYLGDHNKQLKHGERITPALDIAVGRWFTPVLGARLMYSGLSAKGATMNGAHATGDKANIKDNASSGAQFLQNQKFNFANLHADLMLNVTNLFLGYNENRVLDLTPYVGVGYACAKAPSENSMTFNAGLLTSFKVTPAVDINIDVRAASVKDAFDGEIGDNKSEGFWSVAVGAAYKF